MSAIPVVSSEEAAHSVAATLYNIWRLKLIANVMVGRLRDFGLEQDMLEASFTGLHHLLSQEPFTGVGASGIDFFPEPASLSASDRRDVALLQALRGALNALAGNAFARAFGNSSNQDDYRWGKLSRVSLAHPFGRIALDSACGGLQRSLAAAPRPRPRRWLPDREPGRRRECLVVQVHGERRHLPFLPRLPLAPGAGTGAPPGPTRRRARLRQPGREDLRETPRTRSTPRSSRSGLRWTITVCP